jgi:hypothetical protein
MIEWIAEADLVVGDLQAGNFNVGWELGLRHLLRSGQTLLIRPDGTIPPFDLNALRHVGYKQDEQGVSDSAAIEAWAALAPFLASVDESKSDSPVDAVMEVEQWGKVRRREARDANWERLRKAVTAALPDLEQGGSPLRLLVDDLPGAHLSWPVDRDEAPLERYAGRYPHARTATSFADMLADESLDAVVRASHRDLEAVDGVGSVRAREIREGLRRLQEHNLVDRYLQL